MQKKLFSLTLCIALSVMDPLIAMPLESHEDYSKCKCTRLEDIAYKKDDELFDVTETIYTLDPKSLRDILQTPYQSTWIPPGLTERGENAASFTFFLGKKQFEFYSPDKQLRLAEASVLFVFFPQQYYSKDVPYEGKPHNKLDGYFRNPYKIFIREINLSPEDPMFEKGVNLNKDAKKTVRSEESNEETITNFHFQAMKRIEEGIEKLNKEKFYPNLFKENKEYFVRVEYLLQWMKNPCESTWCPECAQPRKGDKRYLFSIEGRQYELFVNYIFAFTIDEALTSSHPDPIIKFWGAPESGFFAGGTGAIRLIK